jgi:hypothetical protein
MRSMMMISTTTSVPGDAANPLTGIPVFGGIVRVVHGLLTDLGIPPWMAETVEFIGLLVLIYVLLRLLIGRALPWLATVLEPAAGWFFERVAMVLLLPELAATRVRARLGRPPLAASYGYGDLVLGLVNAATSVSRVVLSVLPKARQAPRGVPVALAALLILAWNNGTCTPGEVSGRCVSPATHWVTQADHWFKERGS